MKRITILLHTLMLLALLLFGTGCSKKNIAPVVTTHLLRIGILSDSHINADTRHSLYDRLEKELMFFKEKGVDGILITGDLQDKYDFDSASSAMEEFQDIWLRVFPNNINDLTGEYVEPMFIYGNHDEALVDAQYWFDRIGSQYEDAWIKEIKGYQFVGVHYTKESSTTLQKVLEQAKSASPDKPFFFAQHVPMEGTVIGGTAIYDGHYFPIPDTIKKSHNCVVFNGHTHIPITDERSIWQSNSKRDPQFTAVNCGTSHYAHLRDFSKLDVNGDKYGTQQGIYMIVDGNQVTLERYSFADLELIYSDGNAQINMDEVKKIGEPWKFDATQKKDRPYDYEDRAEAAQQPLFPENAVLEIKDLTADSVAVTIPAAVVGTPEGFSDLVQSYYVEVIDTVTSEIVKTVEIATPYHIDTEDCHLDQPITIKLDGLTPCTEYTLFAYARECYQKTSEPISIQITTLS